MESKPIKRKPLPMSWREVHPTTYVEVTDLMDDKGKYLSLPVQISAMELHSLKNPKTHKEEDKLVAYFEGKKKPLILNVTLNKVLQDATGSRNPHDWVGVHLELFVERNVSTPQGVKDVVRFRAKTPVKPV